MMEFVSWDDDIPNIWKNKAMFQTTKQNFYGQQMKLDDVFSTSMKLN